MTDTKIHSLNLRAAGKALEKCKTTDDLVEWSGSPVVKSLEPDEQIYLSLVWAIATLTYREALEEHVK